MNDSLRTIIASNLSALMAKTPSLKSQPKLSARSGVAQSTIGRVLRAEASVTADVLEKLANAFEVTSQSLTTDYSKTKLEMPQTLTLGDGGNIQNNRVRFAGVPLLSWVQAAHYTEVMMQLKNTDYDWLPCPKDLSKDAFALRVVGDSMVSPHGSPTYPHDSIIFVDPNEQPVSGSKVVAIDPETGEATFKMLMIDGGRTFLKPLNSTYPTIQLESVTRIIGTVKAVMIYS